MNSLLPCFLQSATRVLAGYLLLSTLIISHPAYAQNFPELTGRVVDQAQLLDQAEEASLESRLAAHETQTSNQVVVVTVSDLEGYAIADYANRLGRAWQVGTAENNNGALLLVAPASRKVRIEVGYGLEGALTDSLSSIIIQREILPAFRNNNYALGIDRGVTAILNAVQGEYTAPDGQGGSSMPGTLDSYIPLIFIAVVAVTELLRRTGRRKAANGAFPAGFVGLFSTLATGNVLIGIALAILAFLFIYFKGSGNGGGGGRSSSGHHGGYIGTGGGGFGGGGFSGGGGSFGGGGASGSW